MKIVHIGPPLGRFGGPSGYLYELRRAARGRNWQAHEVIFPPVLASPPAPAASRGSRRAFRLMRRLRHQLIGRPAFFRPPVDALRAAHGVVHHNMLQAARETIAEAGDSIAQGLDGADVLFAHDMLAAQHLLRHRRAGQQVWLMLHSPIPLALYLAWSWAVPERDWRDILDLADVRSWIDQELEVCEQVDRVIVPCADAAEEMGRAVPRFAAALSRADYILSGADGPRPATPHASRAQRRRHWGLPVDEPVGLYLGNAQPYRGLDVLFRAVERLPAPRTVPGVIAIGGPRAESVPFHRRLRALGHVADVGGLLDTVDFVVNVNRFSLFDLSTIEATQAGKPLLLHNVGGNKTFRDLGAGCVMLPDLEPATVAAGLEDMWSLAPDTRVALGRASRVCYETHLTPAHVFDRHRALYNAAAAGVRRSSTA